MSTTSAPAALSPSITERDQIYVAGAWRTGGAGSRPVLSPATGQPVGSVGVSNTDDVDAAVAAARTALTGWAGLAAAERSAVLHRLADELSARAADIATLVTAQNGMPITLSVPAEGHGPVEILRYYADLILDEDLETRRPAVGRPGSTVVRHAPIGVVAAIVPWNFPQSLAMFKLAPALAAGCPVVMKPAPETPLDALLLADAAHAAGLPAGVLSVIPGDVEIGRHLVAHPGVDKVAFTGSTAAGREIGEVCGRLLRPVTLELGGKSAAIVLDDADMTSMARGLASASLLNAGQTCYSSTRILVPNSRYQEAVDAIVSMVGSMPIGDPFDAATRVGPLISRTQRDRVMAAIAEATAAGARVATGGEVPDGLPDGNYLAPTVLTDLDNTFAIARQELFAPVLCVIGYDTVEEAISIANDSDYGLGGTIWTRDEERALDLARTIETGAVGINFFSLDIGAPFGGVKASGLGRELGPEGLGVYRVSQSIYLRPPRK
ncbi:aldehyde dehydrogenase [Gordonia rhizosphera]|uniref:Putative aldehyde dehydrogenase n=1 Tax=Gordonia rhizosphera NBRC 16068 TaxID=1108045 RepID=K6V421_9ACTN|nr:aldehyde dehydrogenase [Gordonia rhizosphera]GAB90833.1 putative aldehyde dehydrogenase [Gordonia rhizosphera NBRC 16068]